MADLRGYPQLPAVRRRHVHDVPLRRRAPGPDCPAQRCGTRSDRTSARPAGPPAAVTVGMSGSLALAIQQTTRQRVIPDAVLGRVSAVFLPGEAAASLIGSVAGPFLAQAAHLLAVATAASLVTVSAAALAFLTVPQMPAIIICSPPLSKQSGDS